MKSLKISNKSKLITSLFIILVIVTSLSLFTVSLLKPWVTTMASYVNQWLTVDALSSTKSNKISKVNDIKINYLESGYHRIKVSKKNLSDILWPYYAKGQKPVGFIDFINDKNIILISGLGDIYKIDSETLSYEEIDSNLDEIIESFKYNEVPNGNLNRPPPREGGQCNSCKLSIKDIYIDDVNADNNSHNIYVSYIKIKRKIDKKSCFTLAISKANLNIVNDPLTFKEVFDTRKCIDYVKNFHHAGGRILKIDNDHALFTTGDFGNINILKEPWTPYGKILKINLDNFSYRIFSKGHRNPQGLFQDINSNIFSTEHGPRGGDELNIIIEGSNYGWPESSYGINFNSTIPSYVNIDSHGEYTEPIFYWIPSIGISELLIYEGEEFFRWKNDIIVSSLRDQSLHILRYKKDKNIILNDERIDVGCRIRDIKTDNAGKIYLLCEDPSIIKLEVDINDYKSSKRAIN